MWTPLQCSTCNNDNDSHATPLPSPPSSWCIVTHTTIMMPLLCHDIDAKMVQCTWQRWCWHQWVHDHTHGMAWPWQGNDGEVTMQQRWGNDKKDREMTMMYVQLHPYYQTWWQWLGWGWQWTMMSLHALCTHMPLAVNEPMTHSTYGTMMLRTHNDNYNHYVTMGWSSCCKDVIATRTRNNLLIWAGHFSIACIQYH